jgi:hypothetical protein
VSLGKGVNLVLSVLEVPSILPFFYIAGKVDYFLGAKSFFSLSLYIFINIFYFIA